MGVFKKVLYKLMGTSEELQALYEEKGPCPEYVEGYVALNKTTTVKKKCYAADMYLSVEMYDKAEELLAPIKIGIMSDDDERGLTEFERINLYLYTKRKEQALEIFRKDQKFLDIYWDSPAREQMAGAYYMTITLLLANNGYEDMANVYFRRAQNWTAKRDKLGIQLKICDAGMRLALHKPSGEEAYAAAEQAINEFTMYQHEWQKQAFLRQLEVMRRDAIY